MGAFDYIIQPTGPNIDISLFGDSAQQGAAVGHNVQSIGAAALNGIYEGLAKGQALQQGQQQIEENQNKINQEPVTNAQAQANLDQTRLQNQALSTKSNDLSTQAQINQLLTGPDPQATLQTLNSNPQYQGVLQRNPAFAKDVYGRLDPFMTDAQRQQTATSLDYSKEIEFRHELAKVDATQAAKSKADLSSTYNNLMDGPLNYVTKGMSADQVASQVALYPTGVYKPNEFGTIDPSKPSGAPLDVNSYDVYKIKPDGTQEFAKYTVDKQTFENFNKFANNYATTRKALVSSTASAPAPTPAGPTAYPSISAPQAGVSPTASSAASDTSSVQTPPPGINQSVFDAVTKRQAAIRQSAIQSGTGGSYQAAMKKGQAFAQAQAQAPSLTKVPQSTPVPSNQIPITKTIEVSPIPEKKVTFTPSSLEGKISDAVGAPVKINLPNNIKLNRNTITNVNSIPELQNYPPLIKGMVAQESGGNNFAVSSANAKGLTQLTDAAANDVGVTDSFNPDQNIAGGADYLQRQLDYVNKRITQISGQQGTPIQADPRIGLAAYNGGMRDVKAALDKGLTNWDDIKDYLLSVKGAKAGKENTEYPDKVIAASLAFVKGGNYADDLLIKQLASFGIIDVG